MCYFFSVVKVNFGIRFNFPKNICFPNKYSFLSFKKNSAISFQNTFYHHHSFLKKFAEKIFYNCSLKYNHNK